MRFFATILPLVALISGVTAAPISDDTSPVTPLDKRAAATCGNVFHPAARTNAASVRACNLWRAGTTVGTNRYPHTFNNREGFNFAVGGPYVEFPVMASGAIYTGGTCNMSCKRVNYDLTHGLSRQPWPRPCCYQHCVQAGRHHHPHWCQRKQLRHVPVNGLDPLGLALIGLS